MEDIEALLRRQLETARHDLFVVREENETTIGKLNERIKLLRGALLDMVGKEYEHVSDEELIEMAALELNCEYERAQSAEEEVESLRKGVF